MKVGIEKVNECMKGAYDMHVHPAPDVMERSGDDILFANLAKDAGMKGFAIKSHYVQTGDRAYYAKKSVPDIDVIGTITLNNSVGGINPLAVDIAGRLGCRLVWMPTVDSLNEYQMRGKQDESKLPYWAQMQRQLDADGMVKPPVAVFDKDGKITSDMEDVMSLIKKYGMILASGHLSPAETIKLVKIAVERGLKRIVITHPDFPTTFFTLDQQKELSRYEVLFERCYTTAATGKVPWEYVLKEVRETGPETNILSTDLGQKTSVSPVDGMKKFIEFFLSSGFSVDDVKEMTVENQNRLLR